MKRKRKVEADRLHMGCTSRKSSRRRSASMCLHHSTSVSTHKRPPMFACRTPPRPPTPPATPETHLQLQHPPPPGHERRHMAVVTVIKMAVEETEAE